jgi:site-specific recombinase
VIEAHSILGLTPFFAFVTGVFLWLGSLAAGWVDNWAAYRRLYEAMEFQSGLTALFGKSGAKRFADFLRRNTAGIGGNIALGFLMGLVPKVFSTIGIPLDARHVTLSTGLVSIAAFSAGMDIFSGSVLLEAILGIVACGFLNIGVSFSLAFFVAVRSRGLHSNTRSRLYRKVLKRILMRPWQLFLPPRQA